MKGYLLDTSICDHGVGSTDYFSALNIWMFENKFVSLPSHLKTIEPMEVHRESRTMCNTETSKVISRTDDSVHIGILFHSTCSITMTTDTIMIFTIRT